MYQSQLYIKNKEDSELTVKINKTSYHTLDVMNNNNLKKIKIKSDYISRLFIHNNPLLDTMILDIPNLKHISIVNNNFKQLDIELNLPFIEVISIQDEDELKELSIKCQKIRNLSVQYCSKLTNPKFELDQNELMFPSLDFEVVFNHKTSTYDLYNHYEFKPRLIQKSNIDEKLFS